MSSIAFIIGDHAVYWNSLMLFLGAAAAAMLFCGAYAYQGGELSTAVLLLPPMLLLSILLARLFHWYSLPNSYSGFADAMTDYSSGGYALTGVFAGCLLCILLAGVFSRKKILLILLDSAVLAAAGGIAVGRMAGMFESADKGQIISSIQGLPISYPVINSVTGIQEYRFAAFFWQAVIAALLFAVLILLLLKHSEDGTLFTVFSVVYSASQIVLDSTRYDSLYFRFNGFVSVVQIICAVALAAALITISVCYIKKHEFHKLLVPVWLLSACFFGGAGFMEYYVQRHGSKALMAYSIMSVCLIGITVIIFLLYKQYKRKPEKVRVY